MKLNTKKKEINDWKLKSNIICFEDEDVADCYSRKFSI